MADQASATAGGTQGNTQQQAQDLELQGIVANGVLGGLPVAERNQDFFLIFRGIGGTGPEIIDQTAYFLEYLVDSEGNIFKPTENTSALVNLLQNFQVNKPVNVVVDKASTTNSTMGGQHILTAVGVQQPILYSQTGSSAGAFTGSIFFDGDPQQNIIQLNVPDMTAEMIISGSDVDESVSAVVDYSGFVGGVPGVTTGNARSASLAGGQYIVTSSNFNELQTFDIQATIRVKNTTSSPRDVITGITCPGVSTSKAFVLPANSDYVTLTHNITMGLGQPTQFTFPQFDDGDVFSLRLVSGFNSTDTPIDFMKFGVPGGGVYQNPSPSGSLLQSAGGNAPPFWTTSSDGSLYITASDFLSVNYNNIQITSGDIPGGGSIPSIDGQSVFRHFGLSKIQVPFNIKVGDRIRFGYNPQTDFHIYDVKTPDNETDGKLKLKLNTIISQSFTETQLSNFVLHRTNESIPRYVILNIVKQPGIDTENNPFTGIILPQFPTEKLINNLDSILNKLKVEGIIEN